MIKYVLLCLCLSGCSTYAIKCFGDGKCESWAEAADLAEKYCKRDKSEISFIPHFYVKCDKNEGLK